MNSPAPITIPISFLGEVDTRILAVDEEGLRKMLRYDNKTPEAARAASWRFRQKFGIRTLPGQRYSIAEIQHALRPVPERKRMN